MIHAQEYHPNRKCHGEGGCTIPPTTFRVKGAFRVNGDSSSVGPTDILGVLYGLKILFNMFNRSEKNVEQKF